MARKQWRTLEPIHGLVYLSPPPAKAYDKIGLEGRSQYFASRSAPMGAVAADVVIATFFNFRPQLVANAMDGVWDRFTPSAVLAARLEGIDDALRICLGDALSSTEMERAAELARIASEGCTAPGRPLYAGHASLGWPDDPHLVLWHALSLLREYRGDGHIACLVEAGIDGCEALVLHAATGEIPRAGLQMSRAWRDDEWDAAVDRLVTRGIVDASGAFTDEGRALRAAIESRTDELALAPWAHLGQDGCDELRALGRPFSKAIVDSGQLGMMTQLRSADG